MTARRPATVYLLHLDRPFRHARHYAGVTREEEVETRLVRHRAGRGARMLAAAAAEGIGFVLARVWEDVPWKFERRVKSRGMARLCPICSGEAALRRLRIIRQDA